LLVEEGERDGKKRRGEAGEDSKNLKPRSGEDCFKSRKSSRLPVRFEERGTYGRGNSRTRERTNGGKRLRRGINAHLGKVRKFFYYQYEQSNRALVAERVSRVIRKSSRATRLSSKNRGQKGKRT